MKIYPAIDLKGGACVRLRKGEMDDATVFNDDPAAQARSFAAAGFDRLHVVDLNGAFAGRPVNADAVEAILAATKVPVQLGGGIRDLDTAAAWLDRGIDRIVLGTMAVKNPDLVRQACARWPGRIALGIDARGGKVAVEGWAQTGELPAEELARRFEGAGAAAIIFTDIDRDGILAGVNVAATAALARSVAIPVIASGGVAGVEDIVALKAEAAAGANIDGVIVGRALYDGRVDPAVALDIAGRAA